MQALVVVVVQPSVEVGLQRLDALISRLRMVGHWKLLEHGAVEALDEALSGMMTAVPDDLRSRSVSGYGATIRDMGYREQVRAGRRLDHEL